MNKQESQPLISIITAVYNNEKYIRNVARSVLDQEFKDIEYIIVDDGSTDRTPAIIDEIAREDARVKVIHQKINGFLQVIIMVSKQLLENIFTLLIQTINFRIIFCQRLQSML
ncbi:MAG: glycosyltransferase family 2 protein [Eubacterium sp.]|nr:glycosyltransferase family 2 protein [Eubacterium sp.]